MGKFLLVGGLEHEFCFPFHIWDNDYPIDELIFFQDGYCTTNQSRSIDWMDRNSSFSLGWYGLFYVHQLSFFCFLQGVQDWH